MKRGRSGVVPRNLYDAAVAQNTVLRRQFNSACDLAGQCNAAYRILKLMAAQLATGQVDGVQNAVESFLAENPMPIMGEAARRSSVVES